MTARIGESMICCGLMSGTSRDGIDVAFVEITGRFPDNKIRLIHGETLPYPGRLRGMLMTGYQALSAVDVATLDFWIGRCFGLAVLQALRRAGLRRKDIDLIGSHGQTLLHLPEGMKQGREIVRSTLQVGNGAVIAQITGITTVSDFRSADIAVGGEGAPLVPIYDYVVLRSPSRSRVALNIGGIANLTAIPRGAPLKAIFSFDTGPGNCLIDTAVGVFTGGKETYDKNGVRAARGAVNTRAFEMILSDPYFARKPPKSTDPEKFAGSAPMAFVIEAMLREALADPRDERMRSKLRAADRKRLSNHLANSVTRTATEAVAESITRAIEKFVMPTMRPDEIIVTGGGSKNRFLMDCLRQSIMRSLPRAVVETGEAFGINSDAKEACAFAYLAYLCLKGIPANVISQNAGLKGAVLGAIYRAPKWRAT